MMMDVYRGNIFVLLWMSLTFIQEIYGTSTRPKRTEEFIRFEDKDCLYGKNIDSMKSNHPGSYEDCSNKCRKIETCYGFTVYKNECSFKKWDCKNDLYTKKGVTTFIQTGLKFIPYVNKDCFIGNDISTQYSKRYPYYEDCALMCYENSNCGGFTVHANICYLKNKDCHGDLFEHKERVTFILQEYTRLEGNDCLHGKTIDTLKSQCGPYKQYENCDTWCQERRNCAGYTVSYDVCYFKTKDCWSDLSKQGGRSTFLLLDKTAPEFISFQNKDCLFRNDIDSLKSNQHPTYEDCKKWCHDHGNCAGYTVHENTCYFKNKDCKNDLFRNDGRTTFLLLEFTKFQNKDCLYSKNIDSLQSNKHPNYEDCSTWCRDHRNCGGFTVLGNKCHFKNKDCKNDLSEKKDISTFILEDFVKFEGHDCLVRNDLQSRRSDQPNYEDCRKRCLANNKCGGYTVYVGICYLKSKGCKNDLFKNPGRSTFILEV